MSSFKKGRPFEAQSREIIWNVHQFMKQEAQDAKNEVFSKERFQKVIQRTARAVGVSTRTITRILKEKEQADLGPGLCNRPSFKTPKKGKLNKTHCLELNDFGYQIIRRKIYDFHLLDQQAVTIGALLNKFKEDNIFNGGKQTLRKVIKELGFKITKTETNRRILVERDKIRLLRIQYLRQIKKCRREGRNIVYGDETFVYSTQTECARSDKNGMKVKNPTKGSGLTILHAGGTNGFVPNALFVYQSTHTGDYNHNEINKQNYETWLQENLIPNLQPHSVLVMGNAFKHSTLEDKPPTSSSTKETMREWLTRKNIYFEQNAFKPELYEIIKRHKHEYLKYSLDTKMEAHGHRVLRLPAHHPDFNPFANIWSQVKYHVSKHNDTMNIIKVEQLVNEKLSSIGPDQWRKFLDYAIKCEDEFLTLEGLIDDRLDQFILDTSNNLASSSDSASGDSDSGSDDHSYNSDIEIEENTIFIKEKHVYIKEEID